MLWLEDNILQNNVFSTCILFEHVFVRLKILKSSIHDGSLLGEPR